MISSAVVKRKDASREMQGKSREFEMKRDAPKMIVVAPPKVSLKKVYIPEDRNTSHIQSHLEYKYPVATKKQVKLKPNTQKVETTSMKTLQESQIWETASNMEIRVPTRIFPIDKSHVRRDNAEYSIVSSIQQPTETSRKVNSFISAKWSSNAASQFEFTRKSKKHTMPKDSTVELTVFSITPIKQFSI